MTDAYRHSDFANSKVGEYLGNVVPGLSQWHQTVGNEEGNSPAAAALTTAIQIAVPVLAAKAHYRGKYNKLMKAQKAEIAAAAERRAWIARELESKELAAKEAAAKAAKEAEMLKAKETAFINNKDNIAKVKSAALTYTPPGGNILSDDEAKEILYAVFNANPTNLKYIHSDPKFSKAMAVYRHVMYDIPQIKSNNVLGDVDKIATDYTPAFDPYKIGYYQKQLYNNYYQSNMYSHVIPEDAHGLIESDYMRATPYNLSTNFNRFIEMLQNLQWLKK